MFFSDDRFSEQEKNWIELSQYPDDEPIPTKTPSALIRQCTEVEIAIEKLLTVNGESVRLAWITQNRRVGANPEYRIMSKWRPIAEQLARQGE